MVCVAWGLVVCVNLCLCLIVLRCVNSVIVGSYCYLIICGLGICVVRWFGTAGGSIVCVICCFCVLFVILWVYCLWCLAIILRLVWGVFAMYFLWFGFSIGDHFGFGFWVCARIVLRFDLFGLWFYLLFSWVWLWCGFVFWFGFDSCGFCLWVLVCFWLWFFVGFGVCCFVLLRLGGCLWFVVVVYRWWFDLVLVGLG